MSEAEDVEHAIREAVQELIVPEVHGVKAALRGLRGDLKMGLDAWEFGLIRRAKPC